MFLHGLAERGQAWTGWIPTFARHFHTVRFDQCGFGESGALDEAAGWRIEQSVDAIVALAQALGLERFHLVSAKLGGTIAMAFAARHPRMVKSLAVGRERLVPHRRVQPRHRGARSPRLRAERGAVFGLAVKVQ